MQNSSAFSNGHPKRVLNYHMTRSRIKPFVTFSVILIVAFLAYYYGYKKGLTAINLNIENNSIESSLEDDSQSKVVEETNVLKVQTASNQVETKEVLLGTFNNETYFLKWDETWPADEKGNLIKNTKEPISYTKAKLEKYPKLNLDAKPTMVGENISFGNKYAWVGPVASVTSNYESVMLELNCESCKNDFLILNLKSGRVLDVNVLTASFAARVKEEGSCDLVSVMNFIQNNLIYVCKNSKDEEKIFKYNISSFAPSEIEKLKAKETFICKDETDDPYIANYDTEKNQFIIQVCKSVETENSDSVKNEYSKQREIKIKDTTI